MRHGCGRVESQPFQHDACKHAWPIWKRPGNIYFQMKASRKPRAHHRAHRAANNNESHGHPVSYREKRTPPTFQIAEAFLFAHSRSQGFFVFAQGGPPHLKNVYFYPSTMEWMNVNPSNIRHTCSHDMGVQDSSLNPSNIMHASTHGRSGRWRKTLKC